MFKSKGRGMDIIMKGIFLKKSLIITLVSTLCLSTGLSGCVGSQQELSIEDGMAAITKASEKFADLENGEISFESKNVKYSKETSETTEGLNHNTETLFVNQDGKLDFFNVSISQEDGTREKSRMLKIVGGRFYRMEGAEGTKEMEWKEDPKVESDNVLMEYKAFTAMPNADSDANDIDKIEKIVEGDQTVYHVYLNPEKTMAQAEENYYESIMKNYPPDEADKIIKESKEEQAKNSSPLPEELKWRYTVDKDGLLTGVRGIMKSSDNGDTSELINDSQLLKYNSPEVEKDFEQSTGSNR